VAGIEALTSADDLEVTPLFFELAEHPDPLVRATAVRVLGQRWAQEGGGEEVLRRYFALFEERLGDDASLPVVRAAAALSNPAFEAFGAQAVLQEAYRTRRAEGDLNVLAPLLEAMGGSSLPFLREALNDRNYHLRLAAARTLERLTGEPVDPAAFGEREPPPALDWDLLANLGPEPRVQMETERGPIVIRLLPEQAPLTVQSFVQLVRAGSYDGTRFHRVVPNFVVQGGDFGLGDGTGAPGYTLPSELTQLPFRRGVLGMASAGKDTEGSQFFFTHSHQPHLDGGYSAFGWVESGAEAMDLLQQGDRILSTRVLEGRGS
jgi:peptidylprolyl isomerase